MSSTSDLKRESKRRRTEALVQAFLWILLFVPLSISYLLYSWEKAAPPSPAFWFFSSYGLVTFGAGFAAGRSAARSTSSYRLIEPSAMYLTVIINFYRVPEPEGDRSFYDPQSSGALLCLVIISIGLLSLYNHALCHVGRPDRVVNAEYIVKIRNAIFVGIWNAICCGRSRATDVDTDEELTVPPHMKPDDAV
ncbi:hypothetical protein DFH06DRAFT_730933 [Mycena polygramma]|nr:hypothetical protein DFH06DRAFT_730933 [Mycena polygramma]